MRGDEGQQTNAYPGDGLRERRGPRHAAPRKSLLTKLNLPGGKKALALAAMPTAVFVGMGLTPKLALADGRADIPFAPGPCVTRSDEPSASASPGATPSPSATAQDDGKDQGGKPDPEGTPSTDEAATPKPSASGSAGTPAPAGAGTGDARPGAGADGTARPAGKPTASPTPTPSKNPLDPLGLGDALKDLFDGPDKSKNKDGTGEKDEAGTGAGEKPEASASPSPSPTAGKPKPPEKDTAGDPAKDTAKDPAKDTSEDPAKDEADPRADAIREAAKKAGEDVEELDEDARGLDPKEDEDIPDGAKPRFPCPEADPQALAAAELEPGIPLLPSEPWTLESTLLTLSGLDYQGIVEVRKADGSVKKVLKFTASSIDIKDLHQLTVGPAGTTGHVTSRPGSTSTIRNGEVTMYTEELKGNLFGLIPITFSPSTPPPLNVPFAFFTKVKVVQAGQFGGTLTVPGLKNYLEGGNG